MLKHEAGHPGTPEQHKEPIGGKPMQEAKWNSM